MNSMNLESLRVQEQTRQDEYDYAAKHFGEHPTDREARDNANAAYGRLWEVRRQIVQAKAAVS